MSEQYKEYEEGAQGKEKGRKDDPLKEYRDKEPMTPAKIKEHEPPAVKREMTEEIVLPRETRGNPEEAARLQERREWRKEPPALPRLATSTSRAPLEQTSNYPLLFFRHE